MGGLFHLAQRLLAAGADLLCRRAELPDRSGQGRAEPVEAIGIGLASIALGWLAYDLLCRSSLGSSNLALGICWFIVLLLAAFVLDSLFNARAAYMHVGAIIGSVMVGNVFFVIIPNQRTVVADLVAGRTPDPALGKAAKQRSLHNNYMTLPVLFIMISNHYPMTYGAERPWLVLALLGLTGVAVRHVFNLRHRGQATGRRSPSRRGSRSPASLMSRWRRAADRRRPNRSPTPRFGRSSPRIARACHSAHRPTRRFASPPLGVVLDSWEHVSALARASGGSRSIPKSCRWATPPA